MHTITSRVPATLLALLASATLLSACGRNDERTAGQKVDAVIASGERKADEAAASVREAGRDAKQAASNAVDAVSNKSKDMAITVEVKSRLASDKQLSALDINVDTAEGRVVLRGAAPDAVSRARATELARTVDGVVAVNNELSVQPRSK